MTTDIRKQFGDRVKRLRLKREWEQVDLAVHSGLGRVFISNLENGRHEPKLGTIKKLAKSFGMTASQLIRGI